MTYTAQYNRSARQWDVIDGAGEIVAMCGGGKRGQETAERKAHNLTNTDECLAIVQRMKDILTGAAA